MNPRLKLVVRSGPSAGAEYPLDARVLRLGGEHARTIPLEDPEASPRHAEIVCADEGAAPGECERWTLADLGSGGGTYLNDERVEGSRALRAGDRIRIGQTLFTLEEVGAGRRFRNAVAILIALATLVGALVAWRISVASDNASAADQAGLATLIKRTEVEASISAALYQNLDAFSAYQWRGVLAGLIAAEIERAQAPPGTAGLESDRLFYSNLASIALGFVDPDYIDRAQNPAAERFESERFREASLAEEASRQKLDYAPRFAEADHERDIARWLTVAAVILSLAVLCYTGAEISKSSSKYVLAAAGAGLFLTGATLAALVEIVGR